MTKAIMGAMLAIGSTVKEEGSVSYQWLYGQLTADISLSIYDKIIKLMVTEGLIRKDANLLVWVGH